jgi:hypothetical protein
LLIISRTKGSSQGWCSECAGQVPLITLEEAAVVAGVGPQMIDAWVDAGCVHFILSLLLGLSLSPQREKRARARVWFTKNAGRSWNRAVKHESQKALGLG